MIFQNLQIRPEELPQLESVEFRLLAPASVKVAIIGNLILYGMLAIIMIGGFIAADERLPTFIFYGLPILWLVLLGFSIWLVRKGYEIRGYALREKDIVYRSGVFFRSETAIPFNRVQHCEIKEGPVDRYFKLKSLYIFTAGGQASDLSIPGLLPDEAQQLKDFIIKNAAKDEND